MTIEENTSATVTVTNRYVRELGSLVIVKEVAGDGYLGGTDENFTVRYTCGTGFEGAVTVADGGSATIDGLPARVACSVQEVPPEPDLLSPGFTWGTPSWDPGAVATVPAGGSVTLTVSNPTTAVFGQLRVTKDLTGEVQGVEAGTTFQIVASCSNGDDYPFDLTAGETGSTPDLPVGTSCTVTETPPTGGLRDSSYAWGPPPPPQTVTVTTAGEVVTVTVTNTVVRVTGALTISKTLVDPEGVVDPARTFAIDYVCIHRQDAPVAGSVSLAAGGSTTVEGLLLESRCVVVEDPATLQTPPDPADASWVWLPVTYDPDPPVVVVDSATTTASVTVVNSVRQLTGQFAVTKVVVGEGKAGGYDGEEFAFNVTCTPGESTDFTLVDGASFDSGTQVAGASCTLTELSVPPTSPEFGWDPVSFTINGVPAGTGDSVTFEVPESPPEGDPLQINVINPITLRFGSITVTKTVTGETAGLDPGAPPFAVLIDCDPGRIYLLLVPANGSATQDGIPGGSTCTAAEATPTGGLVDESYAWDAPIYDPADATVTVPVDGTATIGVQNPIVRVTAPVHLVKTFTGPQDVVDPARTYPVSWSCTYAGAVVVSGDENIVADPNGIIVADDVPVTSECTATEGDLGTPSEDPAYRWEEPVITGTTVTLGGQNTMTVANTVAHDNGQVIVQKQVIGETDGYIGTGEAFTLHGQCSVPGTDIPVRIRDGSIADQGEVVVEPVSIGWTCFGVEDTPTQDLLADASYSWGEPILTPSDPFVLTLEDPELVFLVQNPIVRVTSSLTIVKVIDDPFGAVDTGATFTGSYSCVHDPDEPIEGTWEIGPQDNGIFVVPEPLFIGSTCTVTENTPDPGDLTDGSFTWAEPVIDGPATVEAGGSSTVTVTNTVDRLWGGLQVVKIVVDPDGGVLPGATFPGVWECTQGGDSYSGRFIAAPGETTTVFTPDDERVPATARCTITEDTPLEGAELLDASFTWGPARYRPAAVTLVAGEMATLAVRNTVVRVYSEIAISKEVTGPGAALVPDDREYTGTLTCGYGAADPADIAGAITETNPGLVAGLLVGTSCTAVEDSPGFSGAVSAVDPSYVWLDPIINGPVTVAPPDDPTATIVVTNPTARRFGTFRVTKLVTGSTDGISDPGQPYRVEWTCTSMSGESFSGGLEVPADGTRSVPPGRIPAGSECTLTEPLAGMPELVDDTWSWGAPQFDLEEPSEVAGRTLSFAIPPPDELEQEPEVAITLTNRVRHRPAPDLTITKEVTSGPSENDDGTQTIGYDVVVSNPGDAPVDYDLTDEFRFAADVVVEETSLENIEPGDIPVNEDFDGDEQQMVASATIAGGASHRYRVTVTADVSIVSDSAARDCVLDPGEDGTGFLNRATVNPSAEDCAPIPAPGADTGMITIAKVTTVQTTDEFDFVVGGADLTLSSAESRTYEELLPGTYTVTETEQDDWSLSELECEDPSGDSTTFVGERRASIVLAAGETVTCTFTNRFEGQLPATGASGLGQFLRIAAQLVAVGAILALIGWRRNRRRPATA